MVHFDDSEIQEIRLENIDYPVFGLNKLKCQRLFRPKISRVKASVFASIGVKSVYHLHNKMPNTSLATIIYRTEQSGDKAPTRRHSSDRFNATQ